MATVTLVLLSSCNKTCVDTCEFDGDTRVDTFSFFGLDTLWFAGLDSSLVFEGSGGEEIVMERVLFDTTYDIFDQEEGCGECGDTVLVTHYQPTLTYSLNNPVTGNIEFTFLSNRFLEDTNLLYKCIIGKVKIVDQFSSGQTFLAGCNIQLDTNKTIRYNNRYDFEYQRFEDSTSYSCRLDSAALTRIYGGNTTSNITLLELKPGFPISGFEFDGICYDFVRFQ